MPITDSKMMVKVSSAATCVVSVVLVCQRGKKVRSEFRDLSQNALSRGIKFEI